jgi:hypothetical protein
MFANLFSVFHVLHQDQRPMFGASIQFLLRLHLPQLKTGGVAATKLDRIQQRKLLIKATRVTSGERLKEDKFNKPI